jgi:ring-1,2-phenylacetyl-CoA epoxidase subunit PaaC
MSTDLNKNSALFEFLLRYGDDRLILGHRISEWCGHAPILEEDLALANTGLDLLGQAQMALKYAGEVENKGRNEDDLAYKRNEFQIKSLLMCEQDNGDFAKTIARQFFFDAFAFHFNNELVNIKDETIKGIAEKAVKEDKYHLRHSARWFIMLGDGTDESRERLQEAIDDIWKYVGEMFIKDEVDEIMINEYSAPDLSEIKNKWIETVSKTFEEAQLEMPDPNAFAQQGGRKGKHTEAIGHLLAEMQFITRMYPQAEW